MSKIQKEPFPLFLINNIPFIFHNYKPKLYSTWISTNHFTFYVTTYQMQICQLPIEFLEKLNVGRSQHHQTLYKYFKSEQVKHCAFALFSTQQEKSLFIWTNKAADDNIATSQKLSHCLSPCVVTLQPGAVSHDCKTVEVFSFSEEIWSPENILASREAPKAWTVASGPPLPVRCVPFSLSVFTPVLDICSYKRADLNITQKYGLCCGLLKLNISR